MADIPETGPTSQNTVATTPLDVANFPKANDDLVNLAINLPNYEA